MASYRSIRNAFLVVALLGIPVLLLRAAAQEPQGLSGFDRAVRRVGAPLEAGVSYAAGSVGRFFERWVLQARLQEDNETLDAENRQLRLELRALTAVEEENKELRRSLQMRAKVAEDMIAAEISGVEQSPFFRVVKLQIDRGAGFVRPGMAVIADTGVVGRIDRADEANADVMLITDPRSKIAVEVARTRAPGILAGLDEDTCLVHVASDFPVQVGDLIQTSGVDELFPRGHPVGQVVRVEDVVGDQQRVHVVPAVRFDRLDMVWVVLASAPPPDPGAEQPRKPAAAAGLGPLR
ncbi:MAG: rod shape-determining protein MreC [Nannocystis sp.]|nr:rod shape-determining protein MreC [Nannocystis sp.]MBA3544935.1 rod shape-determining protein MreC [Nannocystis sp.]